MATEASNPFDPKKCEEELNKNPETQPVCPEPHCNEFQKSEYYRAACEERAMYYPVQTVGCYNAQTHQWVWAPPKELKSVCQQKAKEDPSWEIEQCFCCCIGPPGNLTAIGVPEGTQRPITEIGKGDTVAAGRTSGGQLEWEPATVGFSQGAHGGGPAPVVRVAYGEREGLTVAPDQPLMLTDGALTTAARLAAGQELMGVNGEPVPVGEVRLGEHEGGVHHIATSPDWNGSIDGHLLQANGVVIGDFTLQLHLSEVASIEFETTTA
ncbi:MAG: hypothetical protein ACTHO8_00495 [Solirubrobacterales bacterium]